MKEMELLAASQKKEQKRIWHEAVYVMSSSK